MLRWWLHMWTFSFSFSDTISTCFCSHFTDIYISRAKSDFGSRQVDANRLSAPLDNGYLGTINSSDNRQLQKEEPAPYVSGVEPSRFLDVRMEGSKPSLGSISALRELVRIQIAFPLWHDQVWVWLSLVLKPESCSSVPVFVHSAWWRV